MSVLKKLRESRNLSYSGLADQIGVSSEEVKRWEEDASSISKDSLSSLAYYLGSSSEELQDMIEGNEPYLTTHPYYILGKGEADGWWGHFGLCLNGKKDSKWFPITLGQANKISNVLDNISSRDEWLIVETLNNRILVFRPTRVSRMWVLDDYADPPEEDWSPPWDGYSGNPSEFYKGLEEYCWLEGDWEDGGEGERSVSNTVIKAVETFTDVHDLDFEKIAELVLETQIYNVEGRTFSHIVEGSRLSELMFSADIGESVMMLNLSNEKFDFYIPSDNVALIDMPKRCVDKYIREERYFEEDENAN
ncbi:helix-turn-helix transcriptional regulator [Marinomonas sp. C2222]|uniref:Helix-turn-helix transcriptional regulator n=1 Tax=Marinomonas sargassi TaxID=2984494 RepID=A0ABT2YVI0_9GAMM|nr:helix-turn-helix transcriptional regulator [Marinomonas sargassi]MCV2403589.1 helix-turn-helix transcriptional regulator [Marinomonas sargassi]